MHAKWNTGPSNRETDDGPIRMREKWNSGTEVEPKIGSLERKRNPMDLLCGPRQGRRQRILNAGAEGVLDQWQGELGN